MKSAFGFPIAVFILLCVFLAHNVFSVEAFAEGMVNPSGAKWTANTEADLAGYKVYHGKVSGEYTGHTDVGNVTQYLWADEVFPDGQYYIVVTAYDESGNESGYSNEVPFVWNRAAPINPLGLELF